MKCPIAAVRSRASRVATVWFVTIVATVSAQALNGRVTLTPRTGNTSLFVEGQSATIFGDIFILTNNSNANAKILSIFTPRLLAVNSEPDDVVVKSSLNKARSRPLATRTSLASRSHAARARPRRTPCSNT